MKHFENELDKQQYYEGLRRHKKMVSKKSNPFNIFEDYSKESLDDFMQSVYDKAMNGDEIKLSGVVIR